MDGKDIPSLTFKTFQYGKETSLKTVSGNNLGKIYTYFIDVEIY